MINSAISSVEKVLCSKLSQSSMGPDIKGKMSTGIFPYLSQLRVTTFCEQKLEKSSRISSKSDRVDFAACIFVTHLIKFVKKIDFSSTVSYLCLTCCLQQL